MPADERDDEEVTDMAAPAAGDEAGSGPDGDSAATGEDEKPRITLDRYLSRRRPQQKAGWMQIVTIVIMLVALLLIIIYKDHCGSAVSGMMEGLRPPPSEESARPPVRYEVRQPPATEQSK
jgi:hypothetical protein